MAGEEIRNRQARRMDEGNMIAEAPGRVRELRERNGSSPRVTEERGGMPDIDKARSALKLKGKHLDRDYHTIRAGRMGGSDARARRWV